MRALPVLTLLAASILAACSDSPAPAEPAQAPPAAVEQTTPVEPAQPADPEVVRSPTEEVAHNLVTKYPVMTVLSVDEVPGTDLFEVRTQEWGVRTLGYTNKSIDYVFVDGKLYIGEGDGLIDHTTKSLNDRTYRLLSQLPFNEALTFTYGDGERSIVVFEDPDCPQCQQFETELEQAGDSLNMTVRVLPLPLTQIHPQAEEKWRHILCTANPEAAWKEWVTEPLARGSWELFTEKHPADAGCARANTVDQVLDLAQQLGLNQTPIVMFTNGMTFNGRPTMEELEKSLTLVEIAESEGVGIRAPEEDTAPVAQADDASAQSN